MGDFKYKAFLSYRSKDRALAAFVFDRLEKWRAPGGLVGKPGRRGAIPKTISPICRDREEFPSSAYVDSVIADKLRASQDLIVLCTPAAAESGSWVGREIELFRQLRPDGEIHAIIGYGDPPGCFPPALLSVGEDGRQRAPLAGDMRRDADGKDRAIVKLIAGVAGVEFDTLWQREIRRRVRNAIVLGVLALAIAGGAYSLKTYFDAQGVVIHSLQPETQEAAFRRYFEQETRQNMYPENGRIEYQIVLSADLNGDGRLDFLVYNQSTGMCGSGGCSIEIHESANGSYRDAGEMFASTNVRVGTERRNGHLSVIAEDWHNRSGHPLYQVYSFGDANTYEVSEYLYCELLFFEACSTPLRFAALGEEAERFRIAPSAVWIDVLAAPEREQPAVLRPAPESPTLVGFNEVQNLYLVFEAPDSFAFVSGQSVVRP